MDGSHAVPGDRTPTLEEFERVPEREERRAVPDTPADMRAKVEDYLSAGARQVWVVEPRTRSATVHGPGAEASTLQAGDALDGGESLPGLRIPVAELFER